MAVILRLPSLKLFVNQLAILVRCVPMSIRAPPLNATTGARRFPSLKETFALVRASTAYSLLVTDMLAYSMNTANVVTQAQILMQTVAGLPNAVWVCLVASKAG